MVLIAKVYLWDCRRSETLPDITGFKLKVKNKYETEKYICIKNNTIGKFTRKWALTSGSVLRNSNWTESSAIRGVIARVISKSDEREARGRFGVAGAITP